MKKIAFFSLIIIVIMINNVFALTYLGSIEGIGDPILAVTAKALGMGNTYIASTQGKDAILYNPANMIIARRPGISVGFGAYPIKETIEDDSEPTNYSSASYYKITSFAFMLPVGSFMRLGIGYRPEMDLNYKHETLVYAAGKVAGLRKIDGVGGINKTIIGMALGLSGKISIGGAYEIHRGANDYDQETTTLESSKQTYEYNSDIDAARYNLGVNLELIDNVLNVGMIYKSEMKQNMDWKTGAKTFTWADNKWPGTPNTDILAEGRIKYDFPYEVGIGLMYEFLERERSSISFDISRVFWEDLRYKETKNTKDINFNKKQNPGFRNTTIIGVGIEHYMSWNTILRYGFTHVPHYSRTSTDTTLFTVGLGYNIRENVGVDIAATYGKRNFIGENVFFTEDEMVDERITNVIVSFDIRFK